LAIDEDIYINMGIRLNGEGNNSPTYNHAFSPCQPYLTKRLDNRRKEGAMANWNKLRIIILVIFGVFLSSSVWAQYSPSGPASPQGDQPAIKDTRGQKGATPIEIPGPRKMQESPSSKAGQPVVKDERGQTGATPIEIPGPRKMKEAAPPKPGEMEVKDTRGQKGATPIEIPGPRK